MLAIGTATELATALSKTMGQWPLSATHCPLPTDQFNNQGQ